MPTSTAKELLQRAVSKGLLTQDQAKDVWAHKAPDKGVEEVAVDKGYMTAEQAKALRLEIEKHDVPREIGGYRIIEKIGEGSMAAVYKAKQLSLDRAVAIKILHPERAAKQDNVDRFRKEARTVAKLNHPNVISGIDRGEQDGLHYFVMEFAQGLPVGFLLQRGGAMDESRVASIASQITRALEHAHEAGLVHRDVKPDNILITKDGIAKLCDLGLVKDKPEETRILGTPNYISPEQAKGNQEVDIRSDLYSFGCTLYHMLAGSPPFAGNAKVVMVKHLSEDPQPIREIEPDVSEEFAKIVKKLMAKDPGDRYQSPKHLMGDLDEYAHAARAAAAGPSVQTRRRRRR
ncbi:MAG: serine/threonine protein kinase [Planctomycetota bacterium]|jgi:serine/threonine-protein kinase